jgi:hypothetical protein
MTSAAPTTPDPHAFLRIDRCASSAFSSIEWKAEAAEVRDEQTGRLIKPSGPSLWVRYRTSGAEWEFWPVSEEEARAVMTPSAIHDFSMGRAFSSIIKAHKSGRQVSAGDRQETRRQREQAQPKPTRRWLA